jgi:ferredoxin
LKYQIEVNREDCIACATCYTLDPDHFESDAEGKSKVRGGISNGKSTGSFDDDKITLAQEAEASCPVSVIKVTKLDSE